MATKTKPKKPAAKKTVSTPAPHGSWSTNNLPKPGQIRYTDAMKKQLIAEVKKADKAGIPRSHVFAALAKEWSTRSKKFTEHQVSSQFHVLKQRFGYDVRRAPMPGTSTRKLVKPKSLSPSMAELLEKMQDEFSELQTALTAELREEKAARRKAERKLERATAKLAEARDDQRLLRKLQNALS